MRRFLSSCLLLLAVVALSWGPAQRYVVAADFLQALSASEPPVGVESTEVVVEGRRGPIRARLYRRPGSHGFPLVAAHGVHYRGIDEERFVPFAEHLASRGAVVITPELTDVIDYRITDLGRDILVDTVRFSSRLTGSEAKVRMLGLSFAGGLSIVAAADPSVRDRVAYVVSVGGHHDLERVLRFLVSDRIETPRGTRTLDAHEYGLVIAVYSAVEQFVPEPDVEIMREALRAWLQEDRPRARAIASQRTTAEADRLFAQLEDGRLAELREDLLRLLSGRRAELAALSPRGHLARVDAPVYLLHGTGDTVIPPAELRWAERELVGRPHQALVTPLLEHVELDGQSALAEKLALVDFMARLF